MAVSEDENSHRLHKLLDEVENRVEKLRETVVAVKNEKENILEILQDMQDGSSYQFLSDGNYVTYFREMISDRMSDSILYIPGTLHTKNVAFFILCIFGNIPATSHHQH